jgi:hypothetical protein
MGVGGHGDTWRQFKIYIFRGKKQGVVPVAFLKKKTKNKKT